MGDGLQWQDCETRAAAPNGGRGGRSFPATKKFGGCSLQRAMCTPLITRLGGLGAIIKLWAGVPKRDAKEWPGPPRIRQGSSGWSYKQRRRRPSPTQFAVSFAPSPTNTRHHHHVALHPTTPPAPWRPGIKKTTRASCSCRSSNIRAQETRYVHSHSHSLLPLCSVATRLHQPLSCQRAVAPQPRYPTLTLISF